MFARLYNAFGMSTVSGGLLGFLFNQLKHRYMRDGKSKESAEFAVSILCYTVAAAKDKSGDNATTMLMLDMLLPQILGHSEMTKMLKQAIAISLACLPDSCLTKTPDLIILALTTAISLGGIAANEQLENAVASQRK